jgi:hypothetical protein
MNIADAILGLQITAGINTTGKNVDPSADVNGDGRIGLAETIYIIQEVAEMR